MLRSPAEHELGTDKSRPNMHRAGDVPQPIYIRAEPVAEWGLDPAGIPKTRDYRTPGNEGLEQAPQCRLPGPKRTLHGYVAYYRS